MPGEAPSRQSSHPKSTAASPSPASFDPEHRDLTIPLQNVSVHVDDSTTSADPIIDAGLRRARQSGWETDGLTDALTLMDTGRLAWQEHTTRWSDTPRICS